MHACVRRCPTCRNRCSTWQAAVEAVDGGAVDGPAVDGVAVGGVAVDGVADVGVAVGEAVGVAVVGVAVGEAVGAAVVGVAVGAGVGVTPENKPQERHFVVSGEITGGGEGRGGEGSEGGS